MPCLKLTRGVLQTYDLPFGEQSGKLRAQDGRCGALRLGDLDPKLSDQGVKSRWQVTGHPFQHAVRRNGFAIVGKIAALSVRQKAAQRSQRLDCFLRNRDEAPALLLN